MADLGRGGVGPSTLGDQRAAWLAARGVRCLATSRPGNVADHMECYRARCTGCGHPRRGPIASCPRPRPPPETTGSRGCPQADRSRLRTGGRCGKHAPREIKPAEFGEQRGEHRVSSSGNVAGHPGDHGGRIGQRAPSAVRLGDVAPEGDPPCTRPRPHGWPGAGGSRVTSTRPTPRRSRTCRGPRSTPSARPLPPWASVPGWPTSLCRPGRSRPSGSAAAG